MKVLVVGNGGREHALCWHLRNRSQGVDLFCAPGSDGIAQCADVVPIPADEVQKLADFAEELGIDLTVVGPELPLSLGIVDEFEARGLRIFGPRREAARLESSKVYAKEFMQRHDIPTGDFEVVHDAREAAAAVDRFGFPVVLKADGLAAGKGVLIVHDATELEDACRTFFEDRRFGQSGDRVVVEEFLEGEEVSFIGLSDGSRILPLATSKDYKRIGDLDTGPNTGGMGAHSPSGVVSAGVAGEVLDRVLRKTISALESEGTSFVGVLYAGVILTAAGPRVLEFNVRLGDPEAQPLLLRLEDDLAGLLLAGARGDFGVSRLRFRSEASACIVLAAEGYPGTPVKGAPISGIDGTAPDAMVFHAGTRRREDGIWEVAGGRVLGVCALGDSLRAALRAAYGAADRIRWPGRQMRTDIGRRVVESGTLRQSGIIHLPPRS